MDVVKRVHIVPLGYEYDRILEPIRNQRADLVYLLEDDGSDPGARTGTTDYHDDLRAELDEIVPEVRTRECDLTDVYAVLGIVTTIAARHADDDVSVNVSGAGTIAARHADDDVSVNVSGAGTIAAIGATMACMDVSTDARAYYVEPDDYDHDGQWEPISSGVAEIEQLPAYPIDSPTPDQVAIMGFLADPTDWEGYHEARTAPPKKKDLIEYARDRELSFMADRRPPEDRGGEDKGAFRVLDTHVLDPLEEDGYVTIESVGRRRVVELTEQGENAYRAFKHKLDSIAGLEAD